MPKKQASRALFEVVRRMLVEPQFLKDLKKAASEDKLKEELEKSGFTLLNKELKALNEVLKTLPTDPTTLTVQQISDEITAPLERKTNSSITDW
ncbi:MAG: hypothetical protein ACXADO_00065 [Candidatus Thorarchaeota archaeon]|jgi:hypothetical protein